MSCTILCKLLDELAENTPRAQVKMSGRAGQWRWRVVPHSAGRGLGCRLCRLLHDLSGLASPDGGLCAHFSPVITAAALPASDWSSASDALLWLAAEVTAGSTCLDLHSAELSLGLFYVSLNRKLVPVRALIIPLRQPIGGLRILQWTN